MKKIALFIILALIAISAIAQQKPDYERSRTNQVLSDYAGKFRYFLAIPKGTALAVPSYVPDSNKTSNLFHKTDEMALYIGGYKYADTVTKIPLIQKGAALGVATLGGDGRVPSTQMPNNSISNHINVIKKHQIYWMGDSQTANGVAVRTLDTLLGSNWWVNNKGVQGERTDNFLSRFVTDVTSHKDAEYAVILGGINDVIFSYPATTTEANLQSMYNQAHAAQLKVIAVTLLPFKGNVNWTLARQAKVDSVNAWIKTSATNVDYRIDAYSIFNDPANPGMMKAIYYGTSPDYLHPNLLGYKVLGQTVYNGVTWTANNVTDTLGITNNVSINQNLRTTDTVIFRDIHLVPNQNNASGGVMGGGNLYMPPTTTTEGIIYSNNSPAIYFTGTGNTTVGISSMPLANAGQYSSNVGYGSLRNATNVSFSDAYGAFSAFNLIDGQGEFLGYQSGFNAVHSTGNVFLGKQSGFYETGNNKLFIDNTLRASEADGRVKAMIYGIFDDSPGASAQELHFNAKTYVNGTFSTNSTVYVGSYGTGASTDSLTVRHGGLLYAVPSTMYFQTTAGVANRLTGNLISALSSTGNTSNIEFNNTSNWNYGVMGSISGTGALGGDVFGLGYNSNSSGAFTPVIAWRDNGFAGVGYTSDPSSGNTFAVNGNSYFNGAINLKGYTVSGLPSGIIGRLAYVTDASSPTWGATVIGGGSTVALVMYDGAAWKVR